MQNKIYIGMDKYSLLNESTLRIKQFCLLNGILCPEISIVDSANWHFNCCAYYRANRISICVERCSHVCTERQVRNWNWPGSVTDRTPYGVLAHELGHHCDVHTALAGKYRVGSYSSDYSQEVMQVSGEKPITSYCPNPAEWFAEMFRLFVTNSDLLANIRPNTHRILSRTFTPVVSDKWKVVLGRNVPERIITTLRNKGAK